MTNIVHPGRHLARQFTDILDRVLPRLRAITPETAQHRASVDAWSPAEIIGHLIDSASNNHGRFVRAQWQDSLIFPGYEQEKWVNVQHYRRADWHHLLDLWRSYNLHLAHVMEQADADVLTRSRSEHDFATMTHGYLADEDPDSLLDLMRDYVAHQEHHLRQILPNYRAIVLGTKR